MKTLTVDSQKNCVQVSQEWMDNLQKIAAAATLEPGIHVLRLSDGTFSYEKDDPGEPFVLLWIYGGKFIDKGTGVESQGTWYTLNGVADTIILEVKETTTVNALFIDIYNDDNTGVVTVSILSEEPPAESEEPPAEG